MGSQAVTIRKGGPWFTPTMPEPPGTLDQQPLEGAGRDQNMGQPCSVRKSSCDPGLMTLEEKLPTKYETPGSGHNVLLVFSRRKLWAHRWILFGMC